jgi:hypothetical protein
LLQWKREREGDSFDVLAGLEGVTEKGLQKMMSDSVVEYQTSIKAALDLLQEEISSEVIGALSPLISQAFELPYLSPDDLVSLKISGDQLSGFAPHVESLSVSTEILDQIAGQIEILFMAGQDLRGLSEATEMLSVSAHDLRGLSNAAESLAETASDLRGLSTAAEMLSDSADLLRRMDPEILAYSAQQITDATSDQRIAEIERAAGGAAIAIRNLTKVAAEKQSANHDKFRPFMYGFATSTCAIALIMALLTYLLKSN